MNPLTPIPDFHEMIKNEWVERDHNTPPSIQVNLNKVEKWFFVYGIPDPKQAALTWKKWITEEYPNAINVPETMIKKVFTLALGISEAMFRHYTHAKYERQRLVPMKTRQKLDYLMRFTGQTPPVFERQSKDKKPSNEENTKRKSIALITELNKLPSLPYHQEVMNSIMLEAEKYKYDLTIYEAKDGNQDEAIIRAILMNLPDGIILVRLKPTKALLNKLKESPIPIILIHSGERLTESPVIGNITSVMERSRDAKLQKDFNKWIRSLPSKNDPQKRAVIVHMPLKDNHRKKRVNYLSLMLRQENYKIDYFEVMDYSFEHAYKVWKRYPEANVYVCLSDQIAVGLKNILMTANNQEQQNNIVGFDGSPLAKREMICSFDQKLHLIGKLVFDKLKAFFKHQNSAVDVEIPIEIEFFNPQER